MEDLSSNDIVVETVVLNDIPLLLSLIKSLGIVESIDGNIVEHGNHEGLSSGWLVGIWLCHILHQSTHAKSVVSDWVLKHRNLLESLTGQSISDTDFDDTRLGRLLRRLSLQSNWLPIEKSLWLNVVEVYEVRGVEQSQEQLVSEGDLPISTPLSGVHIDLTGSCGYHKGSNGLMQYGKSKDNRDDLRQFKLVSAVLHGHLISHEVLSGEQADNAHYLPTAARVSSILDKRGLLYAGDSKMADLQTRATLQYRGDYYLTRLPATPGNADFIKGCIEQGMNSPLDLIYHDGKLLGGGYEFDRQQSAEITLADGQKQQVNWTERVAVVRSGNYAQGQQKRLVRRLEKAIEAIQKLTPPRGRGRRQITQQSVLEQKIKQICEKHKIPLELLHIDFERQVTVIEKNVRRGRATTDSPKKQVQKIRFQIQEVRVDQTALEQHICSLGWIVYVTQVPKKNMNLTQVVTTYRKNNDVEIQFRRLKNAPLNIRPLLVWTDDQIIGLNNLLSIALRLMTYSEAIMAQALQEHPDKQIEGLYPELPTKKTATPTLKRCCMLFSKAEITSVRVFYKGNIIKSELHRFDDIHWKILQLLNIPMTVYTELRI